MSEGGCTHNRWAMVKEEPGGESEILYYHSVMPRRT